MLFSIKCFGIGKICDVCVRSTHLPFGGMSLDNLATKFNELVYLTTEGLLYPNLLAVHSLVLIGSKCWNRLLLEEAIL